MQSNSGPRPELVLTTGHAAGIVAMAVSPDGRILATGSYDHSVILWDLASREMLRPPILNVFPGKLRFSPGGSRLAAFGNGDLTVWDLPTGTVHAPLRDFEGFFLDFEDEGRLLVAQPREENGTLWIGIRDLITGEFDPRWDTGWDELKHLENDLDALVRSHDRSTIAGCTPHEVRLWDAETGTPLCIHPVPETLPIYGQIPAVGILRGPVSYATKVERLALPPGQQVAVAATSALWLMDGKTGRRTRLLTCGDRPEALAVAPDGETLASGHLSGGVVLWGLPSGDPVLEVKAHPSGIDALTFTPDQRCLVSSSRKHDIKLWDVISGKCIGRMPTADAAVDDVAFSPDGTLLASAHGDGTVRLWNTGTGSLVHTRGASTLEVEAIACTGDGRKLVSTRRDARNPYGRCWVDQWAIEPGDCFHTFRTVKYPTWSFAVSPDAEYLVHSTLNETQVWLLQDRELHYELKADVAALSPDGRILATGSGDRGQARLWDLATGALLEKLELPPVQDRLASLRFSPDGRTLYAGTDGFAVIRWNLETGRVAWNRRMDRDHLHALDIAPDGGRLAIGSAYDQRIWIRELPKGTQGRVLHGHRGTISAVAFSTDGTLLASGSEDATIKLWDPTSGQLRMTLGVLPGDGSEPSQDWICHTPEGRWHGSPGAERLVRWTLNGEFVPAPEGS